MRPADAFARSVGLRNRHQLRRILLADGLPCPEDLAAWVRMLEWVVDAEDWGEALSYRALHAAKDASPWYRTVKRLTGMTWRDVLARGHSWVLSQISAVVVGRKANRHPLESIRRRWRSAGNRTPTTTSNS